MFKRTLRDNPHLVISVIVMFAVFALFVITPPFAGIFGMVSIGMEHWVVVGALTIVPTVIAEIGKFRDERNYKALHGRRLVYREQIDM